MHYEKVTADIKTKKGYEGVTVPRRSTIKRCTWRKNKHSSMIWIPFEVMQDVMEFALDHAIVKMRDGQLLRQTGGIPMGDPISPGMTIGACGWMEDEWMQTLAPEVKRRFRAKR